MPRPAPAARANAATARTGGEDKGPASCPRGRRTRDLRKKANYFIFVRFLRSADGLNGRRACRIGVRGKGWRKAHSRRTQGVVRHPDRTGRYAGIMGPLFGRAGAMNDALTMNSSGYGVTYSSFFSWYTKVMTDESNPNDRRIRHEDRPMAKDRRLSLDPSKKVHAVLFKEVLTIRRMERGFMLRMRNGETRYIPEAEMSVLAKQSYLPQMSIVERDQPAPGEEDDGKWPLAAR